MIPNGYERVSRRRRCFACDHADWCLIAIDGSSVICPRVESQRKCGDAGWLHTTDKPIVSSRRFLHSKPDPKPIDFAPMWREWMQRTTSAILAPFADEIGVSRESLRALGCAWAEERKAWAFPMRNESNAIVGIRLRSTTGDKYAVKGSNGSALFIPTNLELMIGSGPRVLICEGPTDCGALLDQGFITIGRPSCNAGGKIICELFRKLRPSLVIIFADADGPGLRGAEQLAEQLWMATKIVAPPRHKDARAWINAGASREVIELVINAAPYVQRRRSA